MKRRICISIFIFVFVLCVFPFDANLEGKASPEADLYAGKWVIECVDCPKRIENLEDRSLRIDSRGYLHIAYGYGKLYYAWQDSAGWHLTTVDDSLDTGYSASLDLDSQDYPHISYYDVFNDELKHAYLDATGWHTETVDKTDSERNHPDSSIAIDDQGYAHIVYYNDVNYSMNYASENSAGWYTQTLHTDPHYFYGDYSLTLDESGYAHISYLDYWPNNLNYIYQNEDGWHVETVDNQGFVGFNSSIALDPLGYPHISYLDSTNRDLKYAYKNMDGWHTETLDANGYFVGQFTSLAMDSNGFAHIGYSIDECDGDTCYELRYAYQDTTGWHIQTVDGNWSAGHSTALVLDSYGNPHISFTANPYPAGDFEMELRHAYKTSGTWQYEVIDREEGGLIARFPSIDMDATGVVHISYYDESKNDLKYARRDDRGWQTQIVDSGGEVGWFSSLAVDNQGYPHISYYDVTNKDLKYAYQDQTGWHYQVIDADGNVGRYSSMVLDQRGFTYISYYDETHDDLKYFYHDDGGWHYQVIDLQGGNDPSIKIDRHGYPHISYTENGLRYLYQDSSGWHLEVVDTEGWFSSSLTLDENDQPHISYGLGSMDGGLGFKYAFKDGDGWHFQMVDNGYNAGAASSIKLNGVGQPLISYSGRSPGAKLSFAYFDPGGWHVSTIDPSSYSGGYSELVLDGHDLPHIGFVWGSGGLRYAYIDTEIPITGLVARNNGPTPTGKETSLFARKASGSYASYAWDFGDGANGAGAETTHFYPGEGVYTATVTASNTVSIASSSTRVLVMGKKAFVPIVTSYKPCRVYYSDNFSSSTSGWPGSDNNDVRYQYLNGEYRILVKSAYWWAAARSGHKASEYKVAVDLRNVNNKAGTYGVLFGGSDDWSQFYTFEIDSMGDYEIWSYTGSSSWRLLEYGFSGHFNLGTASNRLVIERNGTLIKAYVNGHRVTTLPDSTITGIGHVGLTATALSQSNLDVRFDNFIVSSLECDPGADLNLAETNELSGSTVEDTVENWRDQPNARADK